MARVNIIAIVKDYWKISLLPISVGALIYADWSKTQEYKARKAFEANTGTSRLFDKIDLK